MAQAEIGAGDIQLTLGENDMVLRPTLKACTTLSSGRGGITDMVQRCLALEMPAIQAVIVAGLGGRMSKDLPELIFREGLLELSAPCIEFLNTVANGGRPLGLDAEPEDGQAPLANSSQ